MKLEVRLPEYPSTGYSWESDVKPDSHSFEADDPPEEDDEIRFGGLETPIFVFDDVPSGTIVTFSYRRLWEKDKMPLKVVRVSVIDNEGLIDPDTGRYTCCGTDGSFADPFHAAGCPNRQG